MTFSLMVSPWKRERKFSSFLNNMVIDPEVEYYYFQMENECFFNGELIDIHFSDEFSMDLCCFLSKVSTEDT